MSEKKGLVTTAIEHKFLCEGYVLIEETPPFRMYKKGENRIVYHVPSCKVWKRYKFDDTMNDGGEWI